ncbi:MAG: MBL fold metallo-hydrolase [Chloroflexota bacterium]
MPQTPVYPLDLNFLERKGTIAAYLVPCAAPTRYSGGAVLVESGPGSTLESLQTNLDNHGLTLRDVTHVLLTHIHLDHAGAAGHLARMGAQLCVHPVGAAHMLNPEKLLNSAQRIYGEKMKYMWGEFLPVPPEKLTEVQDGETIAVGNLRFTALHTPGHAEHHIAWLFEDKCFSGDAGGVRLPGPLYIRMPFVPPELHLEKWRASLTRLQNAGFKQIVPTHFGIYDDADSHLSAARRIIDETERWLEAVMPADPPIEELRASFMDLQKEQARSFGLSEAIIESYEIANPTRMGADGLQRYWRKVRMAAYPAAMA